MPSTTTSHSSRGGPEADEPPIRSRTRASLLSHFIQDNLLICLIAFRLVNALSIRTFFQPDEYYQSLEPAWWLAFGHGQGAWITWEWQNHLRSALHPAAFAIVYRLGDAFAKALRLSQPIRASVLLAAPKVLQSILAALGDYYTVKLSDQIYGKSSYPSRCTLWMTVGSAWNWFVSTRSFSNCAETTLTIIALYNWPFHWALGTDEVGFQVDERTLRIRQRYPNDTGRVEGQEADVDETTILRRSIFCASLAVILRPTNAIIWIVLTIATFGRGIWHHGMHWEIGAFVREGTLCSSIVLALSALADRIFYGVWTFPLWHFFKFNVLQSLAVFYGNNNWHYYLSQGYPLLLTVGLIPALPGLLNIIIVNRPEPTLSTQSRIILHRLAIISLTLPAALSILSHKEVRFIYPILPPLHIIAGPPLARILGYPDIIGKAQIFTRPKENILITRIGISFLVLTNILLALYTSLTMNSGIISVTTYLRAEFESHYLEAHPHSPSSNTNPSSPPTHAKNLTFAALMPCHSIPWRSHLQYPPTGTEPGISGWALTCEPPLNLNASEKESYLDEADVFYLNPVLWLRTHMSRDIAAGATAPGVYAEQDRRMLWSNPVPDRGVWLEQGDARLNEDEDGDVGIRRRKEKRLWPDYLVFFAQLETLMRRALEGSRYGECRRFFNSHFHDDWRRSGDVVVWCLRPGTEKQRDVSGVKGEL